VRRLRTGYAGTTDAPKIITEKTTSTKNTREQAIAFKTAMIGTSVAGHLDLRIP
jgi:hypothetical protein